MFYNALADIKKGFAGGKSFPQQRFDLSPPYRGSYDLQEIMTKNNPKISAVMMLFYLHDGKPQMVFIERKKYDGVHSGQISFPGGRKDDTDISLLHTALRETHEEVGIESSAIECIGSLTELYIPPSNFVVYPYVGLLNEPPTFRKDDKEVERIISIPVAHLFEDIYKKNATISSRGTSMQVPAYVCQGCVIWGATAIILREAELILSSVS